jgi:metal-responsive CopG/Arc/MetJ family transcriptional regulator
METSSTTIGISIPTKLLAKIDGERGDVPRSRFLQRIVEQTYARKDDAAHTNTNEEGASAQN